MLLMDSWRGMQSLLIVSSSGISHGTIQSDPVAWGGGSASVGLGLNTSKARMLTLV